MVEVVAPPASHEEERDRQALKVFLKTLDILGGPRQLFEYRNLTWLPSLMEAAYVVVFAQEAGKTAAQIAQELGVSRQTVRNILAADTEKVRARLAATKAGSPLRTHVAGGLAKLALQELQQAEAAKPRARRPRQTSRGNRA
ncbi:MAG: hypothetical protein KatS3mg131_1546 [Candidatus Tectimicrobiota bacterium]|nr:MAG: hypothetical protein KatS3mg131_1546 [Candidatus Tectomicrobia bacterium]